MNDEEDFTGWHPFRDLWEWNVRISRDGKEYGILMINIMIQGSKGYKMGAYSHFWNIMVYAPLRSALMWSTGPPAPQNTNSGVIFHKK